jgi:hypothetical protein
MLTAALPSEMAAVPQPPTRHQNIMGQNQEQLYCKASYICGRSFYKKPIDCRSSCCISLVGHEEMAVLLEGERETINLQQYSCTAQGIKVWLAVCRKAQFMSQDKNQVPLQQKYPTGLLFVRATMILE